MTFLKTVLAASAICAALLLSAAHYVGDPPEPARYAGLTAAAILGTDNQVVGTSETSGEGLDTFALGHLIGDLAREP